jgi:beta-lactamase class A
MSLSGYIFASKHVSAERAADQRAMMLQDKREASQFASEVNQLLGADQTDTVNVVTYTKELGMRSLGDNSVFDGASTAKLLTAADFLHHVESGSASLNMQIDSESAGQWLSAMIINSDDTAWSELNTYLTHPDLLSYANKIGYSNYDPDTNTFTASDTALLLNKLYSGSLLNSQDTNLMMKYLGEANYRQYIVAAVPAGDKVYHKIGIDNDTINDAAIITSNNEYLVLVIFTNGNGSYDWSSRQQLIQTITKDAVQAYL